jgi:Flp pilus assembly protein TadD
LGCLYLLLTNLNLPLGYTYTLNAPIQGHPFMPTNIVEIDQQLPELLTDGEGKQAESLLKWVAVTYPKNWQAIVGLAYIAQKRGNFVVASKLLTHANQISPKNATILATLGYCYTLWSQQPATGQNPPPLNAKQLAQLALTTAATINPTDATVLAYQATYALLIEQDKVTTERFLRLALANEPTNITALIQTGLLYLQLGQVHNAKYSLLRAYDLNPKNPLVLDAIANLMNRLDRPQEAIDFAKKATLVDFRDTPERLTLLAKQYEKVGDTAQATTTYQQLQPLYPQNATIALRLALLAEQQAPNSPETRTAFEKAITLQPTLLTDWVTQAHTLLMEEQFDTTKTLLYRILKLNPRQEDALQDLTTLHYRKILRSTAVSPKELTILQTLLQEAQSNHSVTFTPETTLLQQTIGDTKLLALAQLKANIIANNGMLSTSIQQQLKQLHTQATNAPWVQAEIDFLLGEVSTSQQRLLQSAAALNVLSSSRLALLADRWLLMGYYQGAYQLYQLASAKNPSPALAQRLQQTEQLATQANKAIARATEVLSSLSNKKNRQATLLGANPAMVEAKTLLQQALLTTPTDARLYWSLGCLFEAEHQWSWAYQYKQQAYTVNPSQYTLQIQQPEYVKLQAKAIKAGYQPTATPQTNMSHATTRSIPNLAPHFMPVERR